MHTYKIVVRDNDGTTIGEFDRFNNLKFKHVLNREGDCSFDISLKDEKANSQMIQLGKREVYIYRNDDVVWGGHMFNYDGGLSASGGYITIYAMGFMDLLKKRYTASISEHIDKDPSQIMWDEINTSQSKTNGNFRITQGTLALSYPRRKKYEKKQLYELITDWTNIQDGPEIEITQTKVFNTYWPLKGEDKSDNYVFEWEKDIDKIDFVNDFSNPINSAIVIGGGWGEAMATVTRNDLILQKEYKLREEIIPYKDVEELPLLEGKGDNEILKYGVPRREYRVTISPESDPDPLLLQTGDWVRLKADYGFLNIADVVRVYAIEVNYSGGIELVSLSFFYE